MKCFPAGFPFVMWLPVMSMLTLPTTVGPGAATTVRTTVPLASGLALITNPTPWYPGRDLA